MVLETLETLLNCSLLFAVVGAPSVLRMAIWYRRNFTKPVFIWAKPEMVVLTIVFFIVSLVLLIIGVSCIFSHFGYLDTEKFPGYIAEQYLNVGLSCFLMVFGIGILYLSMRKLLVTVVLEQGIVLNLGVLPRRRNIRTISWDIISDYYVVPDYPNATFSLILQESSLRYQRISLKVPTYLKDDFQAYLDQKLHFVQEERNKAHAGKRRYTSEN
jgi:hypothetical protein